VSDSRVLRLPTPKSVVEERAPFADLAQGPDNDSWLVNRHMSFVQKEFDIAKVSRRRSEQPTARILPVSKRFSWPDQTSG